jgi:glucose/arabinose dehydrogenase
MKNTTHFMPGRKSFLLSLFLFLIVLSQMAQAQNFPDGFTQVRVATGISNPTVMAFAPDGRIFVAQQNGVLRIIKNGAMLPTPFMSLSVNSSGERGLIGIAFDPNFTTNNFVYLYHTLPDGSRNRISRYTANGDLVQAGSGVTILDLDPLSSATNHNGGAMVFGADGKLYVAVGDNATRANAQNLDTHKGKILRINSDGSIPAGNPFTGSAQRSRVWAYGLRNPYTMSVQPGTGKLFLNEVGEVTWEEINDATTGGKNFGWPDAEGNSSNTAYVNPVYAYMHGSGDGRGCAITGGTFFNPGTTNYPPQYAGKYFLMDFCNNWINYIDLSVSPATRFPFATSIGGNSLSIATGPDGNLYYLERSSGSLFKIVYSNTAAPQIVTHPSNVTVSASQPATFTVTASGAAPLSYSWQKNGVTIANATSSSYTIASTQASDSGFYRVIVTNASGTATSNAAQLTVTPFNAAPEAQILTPAAGRTYRGGDVISFSGSGSDAEDGTLPASAFSWSVIFHHDAHVHDGPPVASGTTSGSFTIPRTGEVSANVFYRLALTVTDSKGLKRTVTRDILPLKSTLSFATQPAGMQLTLDGTPVTTPASVVSVEGIQRTIGVVSPQTFGGKNYVFDRWLHGGTASQTLNTPENDITYTAVYIESTSGITAGIYKLASVLSSKFMDIEGVSMANGAKVLQWSSNSGNNQKFRIEPVSGGFYKITAVHSSKAIEVPGASTTPGVQLVQNPYTGADNQLWSFTSTGTGSYIITNKLSGQVVDVERALLTDGARITQWTRHNGDNQKWRLDFVSAISARIAESEVSEEAGSTKMHIAPNPAGSEVELTYYASSAKEVEIELFDLNGRKLFSKFVLANAGDNKIPFSVPAFIVSGIYIVQVDQKRERIVINR